jgi:hypothetical protein
MMFGSLPNPIKFDMKYKHVTTNVPLIISENLKRQSHQTCWFLET